MTMRQKSGSCGGCEGCSCSQNTSSGKKLVGVLAAALVIGLGLVLAAWAVPVRGESELGCIDQESFDAALAADQCYVLYDNTVYDMETAKKWDITGHVGQHLCGKVYDAETIQAGPHPVAVMDRFLLGPLCGSEADVVSSEGEGLAGIVDDGDGLKTSGLPQIVILGMSLRRLSQYLALVFFVLNFATCYAMPWAKRVKVPWNGRRPGSDMTDTAGRFSLLHYHVYFAWLGIFFLGLHGVLGFGCVWWGICL